MPRFLLRLRFFLPTAVRRLVTFFVGRRRARGRLARALRFFLAIFLRFAGAFLRAVLRLVVDLRVRAGRDFFVLGMECFITDDSLRLAQVPLSVDSGENPHLSYYR